MKSGVYIVDVAGAVQKMISALPLYFALVKIALLHDRKKRNFNPTAVYIKCKAVEPQQNVNGEWYIGRFDREIDVHRASFVE